MTLSSISTSSSSLLSFRLMSGSMVCDEEAAFSGEENKQESSDNPRDKAREDVSEALNPLRNISRLVGIQSSDHHRDGASVEQDNWDEPTRFLWQTISVATLNLYYLSIYHDVFIVKEYGEPPTVCP